MRCESSGAFRRTVSQFLCFSLLFQGAGIAEALPLQPKQSLVSRSELESARRGTVRSHPQPDTQGPVKRFADRVHSSAEAAGYSLARWLESLRTSAAAENAAPVRVARASGILPLPPRLLAALFASSATTQQAPPKPPFRGTTATEEASSAELAELLGKAGTDQIPLAPGLNLISIPNEPPDPDPAAVFAPIASELAAAVAATTCSTNDPWLRYDPADPAGSDLVAVDQTLGLWVTATSATLLPVTGTLPAATTIELCEGWNLIGFPAGEPRHPRAALASIAGKWQRVFGYDAFDPEDPWEVFSVDVPDWANDLREMRSGRGYWVLANEAVTLEIRNQGPPPTVAIASPADLAVITQPTEITGTVESDRLASWTLTSRPIGDGEAVTLATGNAPISGGALATFDPTLLLNGLYELELTGTDVQGQKVSESIAVAVEGQMKIGHFTLSFVDLALPASGLDIEIIRTYDSRDQRQRDFGVGWTLGIHQGSVRHNRKPGDGWQFQTGFTPCDTILESKSHLTVVRLSDQEVYRFALQLADGDPTQGGCFADARFDFVDGPLPGATLEILGQSQVFFENGSDRVIDVDTFALYEPENVRLTTRDGRIFELALIDGVTLLEDLNGNQLSITPAGITHSSGKGIAFERDAAGRITRITDPLDRSISYDYDAAGNLASFTDRAGATSRFIYEDHLLLDIQDPRGIKPLRNEYDAEGRIVRHIDAFGKVIELGRDLGNRREIVTNRLGASRVLEYDDRGNVVRETDELGKVTTRVFDARDNLLSETDPLNRTTSYTYTLFNDLATLTDPLGHTTGYTYNSRGQLLTVTDPRGGGTGYAYDGRGNLTSTTDALGKVTSFTYSAAGNLETTTDVLGHDTSYDYDAVGNLISETDALDHETVSTYDTAGNRLTESRNRTLADGSTETLVTSFTYDALDRVIATTGADGSTTSTVYNTLGKVLRLVDPLGRATDMTYDAMGRLITTTYPDGTSSSRSYDAEGRLVAQGDRAGRTTSFAFDAAGQLVGTTYADGSSTSNLYDDAGQLVASTDARGNITCYYYDAAGRRTDTIDALGNGMSFGYDANGNQIVIADARGQSMAFTHDAKDQLVRTTYPDDTTTEIEHDALGRRFSETDQAGIKTEFGYDALGRLTSVTDALEQVTRYSYDEVGNRLSQTDANDHVTRFEYDALGRQTARVLPDNARESMTYHADGTLASHTTFSSARRDFEYDAARRLTRRSYPDGSGVTFTYTPTGQRETVTQGRGTTSYTYDARDRLTEKTVPAGYKLSYTYDVEGNRTRLTATVGAEVYSISYIHDALNRLAAVTDSQGGVTDIGYDATGNQSSLAHPNGVTTNYTYDALNRLIELRSETLAGEVLQSYAYTLGASGHRMRIDESDGTSKHYAYDALYRLTQDRVADSTEALIYQRDFSYDPVGNRLEQTIEDGSGPTLLVSTYDERDRLLTAGSESYEWDAQGSLKSQAGTGYGWDLESRMTSVTLEDGLVAETNYDADGNRVATIVTTPGGETTAINYLVDTTGVLSHVIAEVADGAVTTIFTRACDQLVGLYRPASASTKYYHADGLGSVRLLSDAAVSVTDRYSYTAFGELLERLGDDPNPYQFAGEPFDPNVGFYYNRARWLSVSHGRFLSQDPFAGLVEDPISLHRYLYARADTPNFVDPTGRFSLGQAIVVGATIGAIAGGIAGAIYGKSQTGSILSLANLKFILAGAVGGATAGAMIGAAFYLAPAGLWPIVRTGFTQLVRKLANPLGHGKTKFALLSGFALGLGAGLLEPNLIVGITAGISTASLAISDILVRGAIWKRHAIGRVVGPLFARHARTILFPYVQSTIFIAFGFSFGFVTGYTAGAAIRNAFDLARMR